MKNSSESVFDRIALSLSGGGFRASAYSLGTLNALYLLGLLDNVHMLSTASGGTLTGLFYAARRKRGDDFATIYAEAYEWLEKDELLSAAIENWRQAISERRANVKLIHAFANVYDEQLYQYQQQPQHFGVFWRKDTGPPFHLQSLIFGATELYSGLTFRFQHAAFLPKNGFTMPYTKQVDSYYIGNGNVHLDQAQHLRLGDIAAASSCFPVGFEPLVLPDDFENPTTPPLVLRGRAGTEIPKKIAMTDGGVYDNQGIESLLRANDRNAAYCQSEEFKQARHSDKEQELLKPTSLFLVADVGAASTGLYDATKPVFEPDQGLSLRQVVGGAVGVVVALLVAGGLLVGLGCAQGSFWAGSLVVLGVLGAAGLLLGWWGWRKLATCLRALDERIAKDAMPVFLTLTLAQWARLLTVRLETALVLLQEVFTRRARSQNYRALYNRDKPASQAPIVASIIGGLARDYASIRDTQRHKEVACVQATVQKASGMSTTLWWGKKDIERLPAIVTSAGLTLCYRLLRRFEKLKKEKLEKDKSYTLPAPDQEVERRATLLWQAYVRSRGEVILGPEVFKSLDESVKATCTPEALLAVAQAASSPGSAKQAAPTPCRP